MDELEKLNLDAANRTFDIRARNSTELFKSAVEAGAHILRLLNTINAGALIALLAFVGSTVAKQPASPLGFSSFAYPMTLFSLGLVASVIATAGMYFAQFFYAHVPAKETHDLTYPYAHPTEVSTRLNCWGMIFHGATVLAAFISFGLFAAAMYQCIAVFSALKI